MSYDEKEKLVTFSMPLPKDETSDLLNGEIEKDTEAIVIDLSLDKRKQEASKPLYIKRI